MCTHLWGVGTAAPQRNACARVTNGVAKHRQKLQLVGASLGRRRGAFGLSSLAASHRQQHCKEQSPGAHHFEGNGGEGAAAILAER